MYIMTTQLICTFILSITNVIDRSLLCLILLGVIKDFVLKYIFAFTQWILIQNRIKNEKKVIFLFHQVN